MKHLLLTAVLLMGSMVYAHEVNKIVLYPQDVMLHGFKTNAQLNLDQHRWEVLFDGSTRETARWCYPHPNDSDIEIVYSYNDKFRSDEFIKWNITRCIYVERIVDGENTKDAGIASIVISFDGV